MARDADPQSTPDETTLAGVYAAHAGFVYRLCRHLGVPEAAAPDVMHDVFLVVHRRLADYDGRAAMRSWLHGITRNVVMHHQRNYSRRERRLRLVPRPEPRQGPEVEAQRREAARTVEAFLVELDADKRAVFVLADIEGFTAPEIAAAEGIKLNTVYSRLRAARRRLDAWLDARRGGGT